MVADVAGTMIDPSVAVFVGHLIGDWIVQTDWQAANKTRSWKANQQHMLGYHLTLLALISLCMPLRAILVVILVSWATHMIIDRRWPVQWLMATTKSIPFAQSLWGVLVVDQVLHVSILLIVTGVVT